MYERRASASGRGRAFFQAVIAALAGLLVCLLVVLIRYAFQGELGTRHFLRGLPEVAGTDDLPLLPVLRIRETGGEVQLDGDVVTEEAFVEKLRRRDSLHRLLEYPEEAYPRDSIALDCRAEVHFADLLPYVQRARGEGRNRIYLVVNPPWPQQVSIAIRIELEDRGDGLAAQLVVLRFTPETTCADLARDASRIRRTGDAALLELPIPASERAASPR